MHKSRKYGKFLLPLLIFAALAFWRFRNASGSDSCHFDERFSPAKLRYSNHARCRMDCREVTEAEVGEVYLDGMLNCAKSSPEKSQPRFALEEKLNNGSHVRLIIADEGDAHVVVTVIRLDQDFNCKCK